MPRKKVDRLVVFERHGFEPEGESGNQVFGICPFCFRNKMYINPDNYLWDCKKCGKKGNIEKFMEEIAHKNHEQLLLNESSQNYLVENRGLPAEAFTSIDDFGYNGNDYTLLVRNEKGKPVDIRLFNPKNNLRARSTKTCTSGLVGHEKLADIKTKNWGVFFNEGEWDWVAMRWLCKKLLLKMIPVATPGADVFKREWAASFRDRDVVLGYDNDAAGERGELIATERLSSFSRELLYIHWPPDAPPKFDVRDWIVYGAVEKNTPRKCWKTLKLLWKERPRTGDASEYAEVGEDGYEEGYEPVEYGSIKPEDVFKVFSKWLHMKNDEPLAVMFGTMLANKMEGDPLWLFLIAPPGGMKSELLMALAKVKAAYLCSSLTPHALVSGANFGGGGDPSMLPKLDGKVLILKDFTTTLTMHPTARDEIFGQLRDSYDGKFEKFFGNGIVRNYTSKFGILAGCTSNIDAFSSLHAGLGERFLKYRFEGKIDVEDEQSRIRKALSNVNQENGMRDDLQEISKQYFNQKFPKETPHIPASILDRLVPLAMLVSRLRGVVHRDQYNPGMIHAKACHEIGTRIGKQLSKLMIGIAMYYQLKEVDERCYEVVKRVAMGSLSDKIEEIVRVLYREQVAANGNALLTSEIVDAAPDLTRSTIQRTLEDLCMLGVVRQVGPQGKKLWELSGQILKLVESSEVWTVKPVKKKRRKRKKKER